MPIPILPRGEITKTIEEATSFSPPPSLSILELDINDMAPWYNIYGVEQRELAIEALFGTITSVKLERPGKLFFAGRHPYDKFLLYDTGHPKELPTVAAMLKSRLDTTVIPNPVNLQSRRTTYRGREVDIDPQHLTVRIGAAYQHGSYSPYDVPGLVQKAIDAAEQAKTASGKIVVVHYAPANATLIPR